ncbi:MAG: acetyl-CoA carboxylase biotin carboxylase subunit [candidate division Zixibacteria bacterium]|nr:acetyl-CoA carboxylase biotin carboxylase subunit [candidate division Zixibacteria bacterium]
MFKKILIANRGEIALRIIRACRELGIPTVAIYSEADRESLHVRFANEDVCIGPPPPSKSYLDPKRIIAAAEVTGADAIHPGYGFLAENADFAEICAECGLTFIGPSADLIRKMGDKSLARNIMRDAGVPVIPGSDGPVSDPVEAVKIAGQIGFPVIVKAAGGGGGRGMRICREPAELERLMSSAQAEAQAAFGNPIVYLEKYLEGPRHVEIQILGDHAGNLVHLGERDCSVQRRHQKLIEESPSPGINDELRQKMGEMAIKGCQSVGYASAGTIEFLLDKTGNFYFMEMNTRIQVEHPVTEEQTDRDLVKRQILIAAGEPLDFTQSDVTFSGHTIEVRINAENPDHGFRPCPGQIQTFHVPGGHGVRVDTHAYAKYVIPPYYDSLLAKLIVHAKNRDEALIRMLRALDEFIIEGVDTTIPFFRRVMQAPEFRSGQFDTTFVDRLLGTPSESPTTESAPATQDADATASGTAI